MRGGCGIIESGGRGSGEGKEGIHGEADRKSI